MRVKLRAEKAGLAAIGMETGQIVLRYPSASNGNEEKRLRDLAPDIRGGKGAYWCMFAKDVGLDGDVVGDFEYTKQSIGKIRTTQRL